MERTTQIGIGVAVLLALSGGVYYKAKQDAKIGTSETTGAEMPDIKSPDDVDKITIQNGDKPEIDLEKKGDKWEVTKPVAAPANQANVKALVDNLKDLKAKELIVAQPTDEQKKDFQFEPAKQVHVVAYKGADKKTDLMFGKSGGRGQAAIVEGKPGIYAVSGYSTYIYTRELKGWRDQEILKFDDANANQITIEKKDGAISFTKGDDHWSGTFKGKPIERFDEDKVKDALRAWKSLNAEDFADGKSVHDAGLDEPEATVTINLKDNAGKYVLKVGKISSGTSHYVMKEGNETIFILPQYLSDWAVGDLSKYQHPADAGADSGTSPPGPKRDAGAKK